MKLIYLTLFVFCNTLIVLGSELSRGYNDDINWVSLKDGLKEAEQEKKPVLVLIHKSWCGACKALKPKFATDMDIEKLSKEFVMINIMDDEEPKERQYAPDGGYIPRVLFMTKKSLTEDVVVSCATSLNIKLKCTYSKGVVLEDIKNPGGNPQYGYFYPETSNILKSMQTALKAHKSSKAEEL